MIDQPPSTNPSQEMMSNAYERQRLQSILTNPKATPEEIAYAKTILSGEQPQVLTLKQAAERGGMASAAGGAPAWESQAYTPEAQRLLEKIRQQGLK
jgi:hypothetical protein